MTVKNATKIEVYLELGKKRIFAGAIDWPGWHRSGRDEESALQALFNYTQRYEGVLEAAGLEFHPPGSPTAFKVIERLEGDATTDFGAPGQIPSFDSQPIEENQLDHLREILQACWAALDRAVSAAAGVELRKGPRGGGRDLDKIIRHVLGADDAYLSKLGVKYKLDEGGDPQAELAHLRGTILDALSLETLSQIPASGPRGGAHWPPCYFVRRSAWHILDHAWEIEDRSD